MKKFVTVRATFDVAESDLVDGLVKSMLRTIDPLANKVEVIGVVEHGATTSKSEAGKLGAAKRWNGPKLSREELLARDRARKAEYRAAKRGNLNSGRPKVQPGQTLRDYLLKVEPTGQALSTQQLADIVYKAGYRGSANKTALGNSVGPTMSILIREGLYSRPAPGYYERLKSTSN